MYDQMNRRIKMKNGQNNPAAQFQRGRKTLRELDKKSREAVIMQHRLLSDLLMENKGTAYGRKYGFAGIHNAEEYKRRVPFSTYDDYEPYITRMMKGERNLLSARPPVHFAMTSGSVGVPKYIPVSQAEIRKLTKYAAEMAFGVADEYYRNTTGKHVPTGPGLNAIELRVVKTDSGAAVGWVSVGFPHHCLAHLEHDVHPCGGVNRLDAFD